MSNKMVLIAKLEVGDVQQPKGIMLRIRYIQDPKRPAAQNDSPAFYLTERQAKDLILLLGQKLELGQSGPPEEPPPTQH